MNHWKTPVESKIPHMLKCSGSSWFLTEQQGSLGDGVSLEFSFTTTFLKSFIQHARLSFRDEGSSSTDSKI